MIGKELILKLFQAAYIQRWNDKLRPIDFIESDKHGHKMVIAYFLAKCQERKESIHWTGIIEGGIFELLQKIILTDLKSPVFYKIKSDEKKYRELNEFVYSEIHPFLKVLGQNFCERFRTYFLTGEDTLEKRILSVSSTVASQWEFDIIERADPHGFETEEIKNNLLKKIDQYADLECVAELHRPASRSFINLCGQLRFQTRWAYLHRIPKTSVQTHCLFVAILSYLFSLHIGASEKRRYNNFFAGLFHDFPEVLTRDIVTPIKRSIEGLRDFLIEYEKEQMEKIVYPILPKDFHDEMHFFTELETFNHVRVDGEEKHVSIEEIDEKYNEDIFNPCDGELVKTVDDLSAFVEAYAATKNGCMRDEFIRAQDAFRATCEMKKNLGSIDLVEIVKSFS